MGGTASLISTVFGSVLGAAMEKPKKDTSNAVEEERKARAEELRQQEADERRQKREKVLEARKLERKNNRSTLSNGSASLVDAPKVSDRTLKSKLGE